jgi:hypothetical protein
VVRGSTTFLLRSSLVLSVIVAAMLGSSSAVDVAKQDVTVELFYSGVWNEVPDAVYVRDPITITCGDADEAGQPPPASARLTLAGHTYFPGNVTSPLYGLIGRYTPIRITVDTDQRFIGEVASWTPRMSTDLNDTWVLVKAFGISHRLEQGQDPLESTIRRFVDQNSPTAYWPLDDPIGSTSARGLPGNPISIDVLGSVAQFGKGFLAPWLPAGMLGGNIDDAQMATRVSGPSGGFTIDFSFRAPAPGGWGEEEPQFFWVSVVADDRTYRVLVAPDLSDLEMQVSLNISPFTTFGIISDDFGNLLDGQLHHIRMRVTEVAGDDVTLTGWIDGNQIATGTVDIGTASIGAPEVIGFGWFQNPPWTLPNSVGHLALWDPPPPLLASTVAAYSGHTGEPAGERIERLCDEEGVAFVSSGDLGDTQALGPQYPDGFLKILREAADADLGILHDARTSAALRYVTGRSLYSQLAVMAPSFVANEVAPALDPTLDDQSTRNDVTVSNRLSGASERAVDAASVAAIGRVGGRLPDPLNLAADGFLAAQAAWRLHLGTNADLRVPQLVIDLVAAPTLFGAVEDIQPGSRVVQNGLPDTINADTVHLLVRGWSEQIGSHTRKVTFLCVPESPYRIAEVEHIDLGMLLSDSAFRQASLSSDGTSVTISLGAGPDWVHEEDFDILLGGERMTVTALAAASGTFPNRTQLATVVRSVNGIVKTHAGGGIPFTFLHPSYTGL